MLLLGLRLHVLLGDLRPLRAHIGLTILLLDPGVHRLFLLNGYLCSVWGLLTCVRTGSWPLTLRRHIFLGKISVVLHAMNLILLHLGSSGGSCPLVVRLLRGSLLGHPSGIS